MRKLLMGAVLFAVCSACGSEDHPKPVGIVKGDGGKDATADSAPPDSGKPDATVDADVDTGADAVADSAADSEPGDADAGPVVCNTFSIDGPAVAVTLQSGTPPASTGGTIAAGTYWLTQRDAYGGVAPTGTVSRTLVIDATKLSLAEKADDGDGGPSTELRAEFSYTLSSNGALNTVESCPAPGSIDGVFYTATSTELWLFPANDAREVYKLQ